MSAEKLTSIDSQRMKQCCRNTIDMHSAHNQMIVCDKCNELIKLFKDDVPYRNYLKYCKSKGRKTVTDRYLDFNVVIIHQPS